MAGMHADSGPTIGDLRATVRMLQRKLNAIEHVCDEANGLYVRADLIRAALEGERNEPTGPPRDPPPQFRAMIIGENGKPTR